MLGLAAPGLGQHDDRHNRADPRGGEFIVEGEEVRTAPFGTSGQRSREALALRLWAGWILE